MKANEIRDRLTTLLGFEPGQSRILLVGLGKTGYSVARFLFAQGIEFAIADSRDKPPFYQQVLDETPDTPLFLGGFVESAFAVSSHLIVSPGVTLIEPSITVAIANGARVLGDIDLFVCAAEAPVVAITGSNGKSTVTAMVGEMAIQAGKKTAVGGNLGVPALDLIADDVELYVIELSSFQLERTTLLDADAAVVLNVSADHMDRHQNIDSYAFEKSKVYRGNGVKVINADDSRVCAMREEGRKELSFGLRNPADFSLQDERFLSVQGRPLLAVEMLQVQGSHNYANALAALALGAAMGLDEAAMCRALSQFKGLEHRMQKVAEINGVTWVNDSKATNIGACIAALLGFTRKVILIAGGDCKHADMAELAQIIKAKVKAVILLGKDAKLIESAIAGAVPAHVVDTLNDAVLKAASIAEQGETVLLSPACASIDQFENYQQRGHQFVRAVQGLEL